jgi:branched-chain amino acid transport system substrate-binding protein
MTVPNRKPIAAAAVCMALLLLCACGSRLPYSEVVAANAQSGSSGADQSASSGGSAGATASGGDSGGSTATTVAGAPTSDPTSDVGPSATGGGTATGGAGSPEGPASGSTVNVGQLGTNTGLVGSIFSLMRTGAQIWASYVNQHGGLNGHRVNLITADDGGDPSTGLAAAKKLVEQDHVIALVDSNNVLSMPTIAPYLERMHVPLIGGDLVAAPWFQSPSFFPSGVSLKVQVDVAIQAAIQRKATKVGTLVCVEFALICSNVSDVAAHDTPGLGGQVVYSAKVSIAQPDFTSECLAAKSAGVTALFLGLDPASITRVAANCSNQGYHPQYLAISLAFTNSILTPSTVGMIAAAPVFPFTVDSPATQPFIAATKAATGSGPIGEYEALAWVGGRILERASKDLPAQNPTAADVLAGLYQIKGDNFDGLTAPITYVTGKPTVSSTCAFLIQVGTDGFEAPDGLKQRCL